MIKTNAWLFLSKKISNQLANQLWIGRRKIHAFARPSLLSPAKHTLELHLQMQAGFQQHFFQKRKEKKKKNKKKEKNQKKKEIKEKEKKRKPIPLKGDRYKYKYNISYRARACARVAKSVPRLSAWDFCPHKAGITIRANARA